MPSWHWPLSDVPLVLLVSGIVLPPTPWHTDFLLWCGNGISAPSGTVVFDSVYWDAPSGGSTRVVALVVRSSDAQSVPDAWGCKKTGHPRRSRFAPVRARTYRPCVRKHRISEAMPRWELPRRMARELRCQAPCRRSPGHNQSADSPDVPSLTRERGRPTSARRHPVPSPAPSAKPRAPTGHTGGPPCMSYPTHSVACLTDPGHRRIDRPARAAQG